MRKIHLSIIFLTLALSISAKEKEYKPHRLKASFSFQTDIHLTTEKNFTGKSRLMGNSYLTGTVRNDFFELGARFEEMSHPLPGREIEKGLGVPNLYLKGKYKWAEITVGDVYEQFGSGMLLRAYEDRNLGLDNAIRGGRIVLNPADFITFKFLAGQQRNHFDRHWKVFNPNRGSLQAADVEFNINNLFGKGKYAGALLSGGLSLIHKYEISAPLTKMINGRRYRLNQPITVNAFAGRLRLRAGNWDINTEYAYKTQDPNAGNNYIFRHGSALMLTATYARRGISIIAGARRSDNFDFRSSSTASLNDLRINHLLPFTQQQTYTLAALYPYATQPGGEWAFQGEFRYLFNKKTFLGGRYGTNIKISASYVRGIKKQWLDATWENNPQHPDMRGTDGYKSGFFDMGARYFHDIDVEISKKISPSYSFTFVYMNQSYNRKVIEGHADGDAYIFSNIFIYEGKHKLSKKVALRTEVQYLYTPQADKDWLFGLIECSFIPHFIFSLSDCWNSGITREHYYMLSAVGLFGNHRLQLSYGRTRRGIDCSGGVCRLMPATKGLYLSYNVLF